MFFSLHPKVAWYFETLFITKRWLAFIRRTLKIQNAKFSTFWRLTPNAQNSWREPWVAHDHMHPDGCQSLLLGWTWCEQALSGFYPTLTTSNKHQYAKFTNSIVNKVPVRWLRGLHHSIKSDSCALPESRVIGSKLASSLYQIRSRHWSI